MLCIFMIQQIWSHFQETYNKSITEPDSMNVKVVCVPLIHHRDMRAVEITGTEDHVMYFLVINQM